MPRWFTYALSFSCACTSKHQWILGCVRSLQSIGVVRPMRRARARPCVRARAIAREGDRARYHSVTPLKAGAFQMFHCVYRVTERPRAPRIVPNRPRGCSLCLGAHGRFGLLLVANFGHAPRGAVCAPLGGLGRSQALRTSSRRTTYASCSRLRQTWTSITKIYLDRFLRLRFREIKPFNERSTTAIV